jgi:hypothetical protein
MHFWEIEGDEITIIQNLTTYLFFEMCCAMDLDIHRLHSINSDQSWSSW